jgi:IS5 family transposase
LKAHIGVDRDSGLVHTLVTTAANVSDISQTAALLHGQEQEAWLDAGYKKREDMQAALAANGQEVKWHIAKLCKTLEKQAAGWQN